MAQNFRHCFFYKSPWFITYRSFEFAKIFNLLRPFPLWTTARNLIGSALCRIWLPVHRIIDHSRESHNLPLTLSLTAFFVSLVSRPYVIWDIPKKPKWRRLWCLCVRPSARTRPAKWFKTERRRRIFTFFAITSPVGLRFEFWTDWLNPQSMLIPNLFGLFQIFAFKGFKSS